MMMVKKTVTFVAGVATGLYLATHYMDELDDFTHACYRAKRKVKKQMRTMNEHLD